MPALPRPSRLPALDGLRALAVLAVFLVHGTRLSGVTRFDALVGRIATIGWVGVDLFFVLSGFLITRILVATKDAPQYATTFYLRRTCRIFPVYYGALALLFLLPASIHPLEAVGYPPNVAAQGWFWSYASNLAMAWKGYAVIPDGAGHFWSLAVEEQFYLVWPLVVYWTSLRNLRRVAIAIIVVSPLMRWFALEHGVTSLAIYVLPITHADGLAWGALLACWERSHETLNPLRRFAPIGAVAGVATVAAIVVHLGTLDHRAPLVQLVGYSAIAMGMASVLVLAMTTSPGWLSGWPLRSIGRLSYALYVVHLPVLVWLKLQWPTLPAWWGSQLPAQAVLLLAATGLSLALATLSWLTLERAAEHWKDQLTASWQRVQRLQKSVVLRDLG